MRLPRLAVALLLSLAGCASGGGSPDGGSAGDGGNVRDAGRRDSGSTPMGCDPVGFSEMCQAGTDLGDVTIGGRIESEANLVERRGGAQWAIVHFPPQPPEPLPEGPASMEGGGTPRIRFLRNDGDAYRLEVRSACTMVASCGDGASGMATNLTEWSFTDDPALSDEGAGRFSTRNVPWPDTVYVRIYAAQDPACGRYQIEITR